MRGGPSRKFADSYAPCIGRQAKREQCGKRAISTARIFVRIEAQFISSDFQEKFSAGNWRSAELLCRNSGFLQSATAEPAQEGWSYCLTWPINSFLAAIAFPGGLRF